MNFKESESNNVNNQQNKGRKKDIYFDIFFLCILLLKVYL